MAEYVNVGKLSEFPEGRIQAVKVGENSVAVVCLDGRLHAFSNACTHAYMELSSGYLYNAGLACMYHGSVFDIETGEPINGPAATPLTVFDVRVDGENVLVGARE